MKINQVAEDCYSVEKDGVCILLNTYDAEETINGLSNLIYAEEEPTQASIDAEIGQYEYNREMEV
jgi:hypothetical protein